MEDEKIISLLSQNYDLNINSIEKVKNTYKIYANEGKYCIKIIKYNYHHFNFILSAILHLQNRGFNRIPEILKTKNNTMYINFFGNYAYLTKWIDSRVCNYNNVDELSKASSKLGELHELSKGFIVTKDMEPRIGWFSWIDVFKTRKNEILDFKKRIGQKAYKSEFDNLYLDALQEEIERADRSINGLINSKYFKLMEKEVFKLGFCHHDYANHNVLIDIDDNINIIDFDYCILDSHIHDLSEMIVHSMKNGKWSRDKGNIIIKNYLKTNSLLDEEMEVMGEFIRFPQMFWQLGIQMYWEQQPWTEKKFLGRLNSYLEDRDKREKFVDTFFK